MYFLQMIRNTMKWKLIVVFTGLILFVVTTIGTVSFLQTSSTIKRDVQRLSDQVLKQANLNLERYLMGYTQSFLLLTFSPEMEKWLQVEPDDPLDSYLYFQEIRDIYVQPFVYQHPEILSVTLYNTNGNEINYTIKHGFHMNYKFMHSGIEQFMDGNFTVDVRFSEDYVDTNGKRIVIPVITMVKKVRYGAGSGYVKLDIDLDPALRIVNELGIGSEGYGFIVDDDGKIIAHPDPSLITAKLPEDMLTRIGAKANGTFFRGDTNEFVLYRSIESSNWNTVVVVPYAEFARSIFFIREFTMLVAAAALFISFIIAIALSSSLTKRIAKLRKIIKDTARGKFDAKADIGGTDEVAELGFAFNAMLEDLDSTVNALAESKVMQQKAVLSALQSQIDSHFLYNTLESINSLANLAGHKEIEQTTIALSKMLRYTSDYKSTVVPISEEIRHLIHYLDIMKIRLGDEFEYDLRVDPRCEEAYCLKAIMQPIVENSMKHANVPFGIPLRVAVDIGIAAFDGTDYIVARLTDNGQGFPELKREWMNEQIQKINLSPLHHQHANIGLLNIHFRLKMYYPNDPYAGMTLDNTEGDSGAAVEIRFPLQSHAKQEVMSHVL